MAGCMDVFQVRCLGFFFFKQKTAYEISGDWSSDVCSSDLPVSLERNTEVFRQHFLGASSTLLIWTGGLTPLLCLEGVPDLPVAPQDEAGLTTTFQTWPPGCFHIAKHPDFPVPS